ncbi:MAG: histone deacetylase [Myxococcota bacterium]
MPPSPKAAAHPKASAAHRVRIVEDARYQHHIAPEGHPERPERLVAVGEAIDEFRDRATIVAPRPATPEEIARVHAHQMIDVLADTQTAEPGHLDADTYYSPLSYEVARLAAGGSIDLVRQILGGEIQSGLAAIRPPGHHAEANRSMGFCLFNNVAVAVRAAQAEMGQPRILVFDWDVHHGNGTQHSFEDDPDVLYISTHQFPFYPGTGDFGEIGTGRGEGTTLNLPMPPGCGDAEYLGLVQRIIVPAAHAFAPDLILISCGFDAHRDDPLASMDLTLEGYRGMATLMRALAESLCGGRIAHILEGGYALSGVREGATAVLESLTAETLPALPAETELEPGSALRRMVDRAVEVHGGRIPGLGAL